MVYLRRKSTRLVRRKIFFVVAIFTSIRAASTCYWKRWLIFSLSVECLVTLYGPKYFSSWVCGFVFRAAQTHTKPMLWMSKTQTCVAPPLFMLFRCYYSFVCGRYTFIIPIITVRYGWLLFCERCFCLFSGMRTDKSVCVCVDGSGEDEFSERRGRCGENNERLCRLKEKI
jgi:hypothetical protein